MTHQTQSRQVARKILFGEIFQIAGLILAIFGGVIGTFGYLDRSEAVRFQQQGQLGKGTVTRKYQTRSYSYKGRRLTGYLADISYSERPNSSASKKLVQKKVESMQDFLEVTENFDPIKDFGNFNWNSETGTVKLTREQFKTTLENSAVDIYYLPDREGEIALKSWVNSHAEESLLSIYLPAFLFVLPGTALIVWGTLQRVRAY